MIDQLEKSEKKSTRKYAKFCRQFEFSELNIAEWFQHAGDDDAADSSAESESAIQHASPISAATQQCAGLLAFAGSFKF